MFSWQDRPHLYFKILLPTHSFIAQLHPLSFSTEQLFRLMDKFSWRRISSIHDDSDIYFRTTADNFASEVNADTTLELVTHISTSLPYISDVFANPIKHDLYFKIFRQY